MESTLGIILAFVLVGLVALARSFFKVEEGHHALLSSFGAVRRAEGKPVMYGAGLHMRKP